MFREKSESEDHREAKLEKSVETVSEVGGWRRRRDGTPRAAAVAASRRPTAAAAARRDRDREYFSRTSQVVWRRCEPSRARLSSSERRHVRAAGAGRAVSARCSRCRAPVPPWSPRDDRAARPAPRPRRAALAARHRPRPVTVSSVQVLAKAQSTG